MVQSLTLDAFIILIVLLLAVLGFVRGGLREICTAAGLLFGVAMVSQWAAPWGDWLARSVDVDRGAARFLMAVCILTVTTMVCGYGAASAFVYRPGPGGRMYGALLGMLIGILFVGYIINFVSVYLLDGRYPDVVKSAYIARALSVGIEWVLLGVAGVVVLATAFGLLVREEAPDQYMEALGPIRSDRGFNRQRSEAPAAAPQPTLADKVEPVAAGPAVPAAMSETQTAPMRIREVRHWEEPTGPAPDLDSGWSQTWPVSAAGTTPRPPWDGGGRRRPQSSTSGERSTPASRPAPEKPRDDADVLREWLAEDDDAPSSPRPRRDE